jgi:hypothetical protein
MNYLPGLASNCNPPDLCLLSRIIGMSHECPAGIFFFYHENVYCSYIFFVCQPMLLWYLVGDGCGAKLYSFKTQVPLLSVLHR